MAIITISRGSYSKGKEVAEGVAKKLGYDCISREIMLEASEEFNISEIKLVRAIHDAPNILNRLSRGKDKYISFVQKVLLQYFRKDNVVYHGLAGHFFVKDISHALKVRIISDLDDRARLEMEREGITRAEALHLLKKDDEERRKWSEYMYGIDTNDSSLYDLLIHIHRITVEDAVDIICHSAGLKHFQTTSESQNALEDLLLSVEVKAALSGFDPDIKVSAKNGTVFIRMDAPFVHHSPLINDIKKIAAGIEGVKNIEIDVEPIVPLSE